MFGKPTFASIVRKLDTMAQQLETLAHDNDCECTYKEDAASALQVEALNHKAEANRAKAVAQNIRALIEV
jgi:broad-specificity NMP kinase